MTKLLIVDDEPAIVASLSELLRAEGYELASASDLASARAGFDRSIDLVLLDWMLPDGSGIDLLREWRAKSSVPVIFITARTEVVDRVVALELGADDYVLKPMDGRELVARVRARLRTPNSPPAARTLRVGNIEVDRDSCEVRRAGEPVLMTRMELGLLTLLLEHPGRVFTREELLNRVWGYERTPTTRTVDTHVLQLRQKLGAELIESVRGIGYRLRKDGA